MRQGRMLATPVIAMALTLALGAGVALDAATAAPTHAARSVAAAKSPAAKPRAQKSANRLHQFTGYVTALDKSSLTVEKRGKAPRSMTFVRHDEMRVTGELEKEAHVTVYYREEGGRAVARRVVVKSAEADAKSER